MLKIVLCLNTVSRKDERKEFRSELFKLDYSFELHLDLDKDPN